MNRLKRLVRRWLLRRHPGRLLGPPLPEWAMADPGRYSLVLRWCVFERRLWWWSGAGAERFREFRAAGTRVG